MRLLAVDDDPEFLETLSQQLEDFGCEVETVQSGAEALKALKQSRFDLVLLDVMMPGMSGDEVARRIRTQRRFDDLPIVLLTCLSDARAISDSILSGANYYVSKTSPPEVMVEVVRQAVQLSQTPPARGSSEALREPAGLVDPEAARTAAARVGEPATEPQGEHLRSQEDHVG